MQDDTIAVNLKFAKRLLARADACARERGVSRAEFVRICVDAECGRSEAQAARRERLARAEERKAGTGARVVLPDGTRITMDRHDGRRGTCHFPDGRIYEGEFKDGLMHGEGVLTLPDKARIAGTFRKGLPHGPGAFVEPDGTRIKREWQDGEPI